MNHETISHKVLIAVPAPADRQFLLDALKPENETFTALSGEETLRIVEAERPDLIVLDVLLPGLDAYEVCHRLAGDKATAAIPVIFVADKTAESKVIDNLAVGAADYILKPFSLPIVRLRVKNLLELKHTRDKISSIISIDELTGVPNRRRFMEAFENEWRRCARYSRMLSLILIDIDYFTLFSVNQGAEASDECIWKVARELSYSLRRPSDMVSRFGGESFAAILSETDSQGTAFVAEMMQRNIAGLNLKNPSSPIADRITLSIGAAIIIPRHNESSSLLVKAAEKALAEAKSQGRNRTELISLIG